MNDKSLKKRLFKFLVIEPSTRLKTSCAPLVNIIWILRINVIIAIAIPISVAVFRLMEKQIKLDIIYPSHLNLDLQVVWV